MNGWTEDDAPDVRTRDLAERQRTIMGDGYVWPAEYPYHAHIPRRTDWPRVAILIGVGLLSLAVVLGIGGILVYVLTAF